MQSAVQRDHSGLQPLSGYTHIKRWKELKNIFILLKAPWLCCVVTVVEERYSKSKYESLLQDSSFFSYYFIRQLQYRRSTKISKHYTTVREQQEKKSQVRFVKQEAAVTGNISAATAPFLCQGSHLWHHCNRHSLGRKDG